MQLEKLYKENWWNFGYYNTNFLHIYTHPCLLTISFVNKSGFCIDLIKMNLNFCTKTIGWSFSNLPLVGVRHHLLWTTYALIRKFLREANLYSQPQKYIYVSLHLCKSLRSTKSYVPSHHFWVSRNTQSRQHWYFCATSNGYIVNSWDLNPSQSKCSFAMVLWIHTEETHFSILLFFNYKQNKTAKITKFV